MTPRPRAVLFDRDGTLVHDVPYNGDPGRVRPMPGAREAVASLRAHGFRLGVVTNQSGVGRGLITAADAAAVNAAVDTLLGPFDVWEVCPHPPEDGCRCRKPAPGLVLAAAARLGVRPADAVVVGDIAADVMAARNAGARAVLVPNAATTLSELTAPTRVAASLTAAADLIRSGRPWDFTANPRHVCSSAGWVSDTPSS